MDITCVTYGYHVLLNSTQTLFKIVLLNSTETSFKIVLLNSTDTLFKIVLLNGKGAIRMCVTCH